MTGIRVIIGFLFIIAGLSKIHDLEHFAEIAVGFTGILPSYTRLAARILPWLEITLGVLLTFGLLTRLALVATEITLIGFTIGIGFALLKGNQIDCGCFGELDTEKVNGKVFLRDVILVVANGGICLFESGRWTVDRLFSKHTMIELVGAIPEFWFAVILIVLVTLVVSYFCYLISAWNRDMVYH